MGDVERWHTRLRERGLADAGVRNQHKLLALSGFEKKTQRTPDRELALAEARLRARPATPNVSTSWAKSSA